MGLILEVDVLVNRLLGKTKNRVLFAKSSNVPYLYRFKFEFLPRQLAYPLL